jgi:septal ring factor EnvC (AmiA/AmiB activator)
VHYEVRVIVKCVVIYIQFSISQIVFPAAATIEQENLQSYIERINNALGEESTNVQELRRTLHSTMNESTAATAERPTLRQTNTKQKNNQMQRL